VIWWTERRTITPDEMRLLEGISDLAGIFLENAELYHEAAEANRAKDEFLATLSTSCATRSGPSTTRSPRSTGSAAGRSRRSGCARSSTGRRTTWRAWWTTCSTWPGPPPARSRSTVSSST
jgi:hypothetical protein